MTSGLDGVLVTPLRRIPVESGDVLHGMKRSDPGFAGFGEAYFSFVTHAAVKGWKRHRAATLNLVVPVGAIQFCLRSDEGGGLEILLASEPTANRVRLTVPPGLWMAFGGVGTGINVLANVTSLPHDPTEADTAPLGDFPWSWEARR